MHNHSICDACWFERSPGTFPVRVTAMQTGVARRCCFCGMAHASGIFVKGTKEKHCQPRLDDCAFCDNGTLVTEAGGTVVRCDNCGVTTPAMTETARTAGIAAGTALKSLVVAPAVGAPTWISTDECAGDCDPAVEAGPPPRAAVFVGRADTEEPCTRCPEGTSPHVAGYVLRWRDGALNCERRACKRVLADMIEAVLFGDKLKD